jgi:phospholipid/cholesterol/gamma-HCH transport system substrate-binding protein
MEPLRKLDENLAKLQSGQGSIGQALHDGQQYASALAQVAELRNSISSMKNADLMKSDQMHRDLSRQVDSMIQAVDAFNAGPLLTTSAVYENLNGMAREVQGTVKDFRENPKKYLRMKLF